MTNERQHKKLDLWKESIELVTSIYETTKKFPREEEFGLKSQLRRAAVSVPFNIAEGSGSISNKEFRQFLNIARRSTFENANILIVLNKRNIITEEQLNSLLEKLDILCRKVTNFQKSLC